MNLLLLGAGFSRNWGGWLASEVFEWLLGHPAVQGRPDTKRMLWSAQRSGEGFEGALSELQRAYVTAPEKHREALIEMQNAIAEMFDDMNKGMHLRQFEFSQDREWQVATFLGQFDAIFTLNQDTLLEHFYCNDNVQFNNPHRWNGVVLPGLVRGAVMDTAFAHSWAYCEWSPAAGKQINVPERHQPIFKLHGSSNWTTATGSPLLIIGGSKSKAIEDTPMLQAYMDQFQSFMTTKDAKLMTIG